MDELTTTVGIVALVGAALGAICLIAVIALAVRLGRVRGQQRAVLGDRGEEDLVAHAANLEEEFRALHAFVEDAAGTLHDRVRAAEERLDGAIAYRALVRFDAYGETGGRQSTSIALLDAQRSGVVLSSIHHREQARLYAKVVVHGESEIALSPEETEVVRQALATEPGRAAPPAAAPAPAAASDHEPEPAP